MIAIKLYYVIKLCNASIQLTNIYLHIGLSNTVHIEKDTQDFLKPIVTFNVSNCLLVHYIRSPWKSALLLIICNFISLTAHHQNPGIY